MHAQTLPAPALGAARRALTGALVMGLACLYAPALPVVAQTQATTVAHASLPEGLQLLAGERERVQEALRSMAPDMLYLTFARIHAAFRQQIGRDDLRLARALIDYAALAESELAARGLERPDATESASEMLRLYELVL
ncbi:hypothetical protein [Pararhodobacter sp.]|uniref:hypothetical protein n=1 Tax=Pararhodobacter sp. TaxID=2127056 RepID=UPI002FDC8069